MRNVWVKEVFSNCPKFKMYYVVEDMFGKCQSIQEISVSSTGVGISDTCMAS